MKKIEIIIRPSKLEDVKQQLSAIGIHGMNYTEIRGFGRQRRHTEVYRGSTYEVDCLPKIKLDIVIHDEALDKVLAAVTAAARTGNIGGLGLPILLSWLVGGAFAAAAAWAVG